MKGAGRICAVVSFATKTEAQRGEKGLKNGLGEGQRFVQCLGRKGALSVRFVSFFFVPGHDYASQNLCTCTHVLLCVCMRSHASLRLNRCAWHDLYTVFFVRAYASLCVISSVCVCLLLCISRRLCSSLNVGSRSSDFHTHVLC